jgi:cell division septum initiation protein DivIVA
MVEEARKLPVGGGSVISRQRLLDLIDRMRLAVPREVYDSRELLSQREELLEGAREEAAQLLADTRTELENRLKDTAVVRAAEERSRELISAAQERAQALLTEAQEQARGRLDDAQEAGRAQMHEADAYALQTLRRLEQELDGFMATVRRGIDTLEQRAAERPGG